MKQQCLNQFNNSTAGKAINFLSPISFLLGPDRLGSAIETFGGGGVKFALVKAGQAAGGAPVSLEANPGGVLAGLAADATEAFAEAVALPAVAGAAGLQILAHAGCSTTAQTMPAVAGAGYTSF
jgi:hypothetical protein